VESGQGGIGSRANEYKRQRDWENGHEVVGSLEKLATRTASSQGQSGWEKT
jgi:hypothetical protein